MEVIFRFERQRAQIILSPTDPIDEANLATIRQFGDKSIKFKMGLVKEFVIETELSNGRETGSRAAQPKEDSLP
jgi:hypothetical protein